MSCWLTSTAGSFYPAHLLKLKADPRLVFFEAVFNIRNIATERGTKARAEKDFVGNFMKQSLLL